MLDFGNHLRIVATLLDRERVRNYSLIILAMVAVATVLNAVLGNWPLALSGDAVLPDYLAHWTGGRLVADGRVGELYDPEVQGQLQQSELPGYQTLSWFVAPPPTALLYLPFAWLPYRWSLLVWCAVTLGLLAASLRLVRPLLPTRPPADRRLFALAFLALPPVFELVAGGQDSAVTLVVLLAALRLLSAGREGACGAVLALSLFKPHLLVLVPVALLVQRRYRALASLAATTVGLVLLTLPVVGWRAWLQWGQALASPLYTNEVQVDQTWKMQSVSALATALGAPTRAAYPVLAAGAVVLFVVGRRYRSDTVHLWSLAVLFGLVFSPHAMVYDLVLLLPVLALAWARFDTAAVRVVGLITVILLWSMPLRHVLSGASGGLPALDHPWSALPLLGLLLLLARPGQQQDRQPSAARTSVDETAG